MSKEKIRSLLQKKKQSKANGKQLDRLCVQYMKVSDLVMSEYNPRTIDAASLEGLQSSINRFGLVEPIIWNKRTSRVVGGHQRLQALRRLGQENTDVTVVDLSEQDEKSLNLALNNPHLQGTFDPQKLEVLLQDLEQSLPELNFAELRLNDLDTSTFAFQSVDTSSVEDAIPPDDFQEVDETINTEHQCPKCGYEWSGASR